MAQIRKLNLIVAQSDIVSVLTELIELECVEPFEPELILEPDELNNLISREIMELENYDANFDCIVMLTTQYTYFMSAWVPVEFEPKLTDMLSKFMCAWEITDISSKEAENAPITIKYPRLLSKIRSGGRRIFVPLSKGFPS